MIKEINSEEIAEELNNLPEDVLFVLSSDFETDQNIKLKKEFNFNDEESKIINIFYLSILFKINSISDLPLFVKEKLKITDQNIVASILKHFLLRLYNFGDYFLETIGFLNRLNMTIPSQPPLIDKAKKSRELEEQKSREFLNQTLKKEYVNESVSQALDQYPSLGEQLITSSPIKIRIFPTPVRPSIKNWIEDYQAVMGAQRHGMMERGNYLFHSENTKKLIAGDRKKLAEVLRSLDEDVTLKIDPENQEIFFEETSESPKIPASIISDQPIQPIQQPVQKVEKPPIQQSPVVNLSSKPGPRPVSPVQAIPFQKPVQMQNYPAKPVFSQKGESRISSGDVSRPTIQKPEYNPRADFQKQNVNNFFRPEQIKPEQPKPAFQEKKQNDYFSRYASNAGKSWEEVSKEDDSFSSNNPKIVGNIVDLKN